MRAVSLRVPLQITGRIRTRVFGQTVRQTCSYITAAAAIPPHRHLTYDTICWNFRPLLLQRSSPIIIASLGSDAVDLPIHKRVLLESQERALAAAALQVLENAAHLYLLFGGYYTRLVDIWGHRGSRISPDLSAVSEGLYLPSPIPPARLKTEDGSSPGPRAKPDTEEMR